MRCRAYQKLFLVLIVIYYFYLHLYKTYSIHTATISFYLSTVSTQYTVLKVKTCIRYSKSLFSMFISRLKVHDIPNIYNLE